MTNILVVEDDLIIAEDIAMMLENLGYYVSDTQPSGEAAIKSIIQKRPDIVFMDIGLRGALDGIETAQIIYETYQVPLIFLTANADDASFQRAKTTRPYAFITKPFRQSELKYAVELVIERLEEEKNMTAQYTHNTENDIIHLLEDRIFVRHKDKMLRILVSDILFAEADRNYCKIYTSTAEYVIVQPLGTFEEKLKSPNFQRIHRSYIVNITKIDSISDTLSHVNIGKQALPVSRAFQDILAQSIKIV